LALRVRCRYHDGKGVAGKNPWVGMERKELKVRLPRWKQLQLDKLRCLTDATMSELVSEALSMYFARNRLVPVVEDHEEGGREPVSGQ
jgi:hypothetical protein